MATISATSQQTTVSLTVTASASRSGGTVTISCPWTLKANYPGPYYSYGKVNGDTVKTNSNNTSNDGFTFTGTKTLTYTEYGAKTYTIPIQVHGQGYSGGGTQAKTTDGSVTASISAAQFTVTFDDNYTGGSSSTQTETYGSSWTLPTDPTRSGYAFLGWFDDPDAGSQVEAGDTVTITSNTTLYAHWSPLSILHVVSSGEAKTITTIKVVQSGTVRNIVGVYAVSGGEVHQGV